MKINEKTFLSLLVKDFDADMAAESAGLIQLHENFS